jgi:hypothetical protein
MEGEIRMKLFTLCNGYKEHLPELLASVKDKLDLSVYMMKGPWQKRWWVDWQLEIAKRHENETIMFLDAYDMLFVGDADYVNSWDGELLHSTCKDCWPATSRKSKYPEIDSPWRFLNSGGTAGKGRAIREAIEWGNAHCPMPQPAYPRDTDQRFWTDVYLSGFGELDSRCEMWQDINMAKPGELGYDDKGVINLVHGTRPQFLHASAKTWGEIPECLLPSS